MVGGHPYPRGRWVSVGGVGRVPEPSKTIPMMMLCLLVLKTKNLRREVQEVVIKFQFLGRKCGGV